MSAVDFAVVCAGLGVLLACGSWSIKIIHDVMLRSGSANRRGAGQMNAGPEPMDLMGQRLHEIRDAQFGRPMIDPNRGRSSIVDASPALRRARKSP